MKNTATGNWVSSQVFAIESASQKRMVMMMTMMMRMQVILCIQWSFWHSSHNSEQANFHNCGLCWRQIWIATAISFEMFASIANDVLVHSPTFANKSDGTDILSYMFSKGCSAENNDFPAICTVRP